MSYRNQVISFVMNHYKSFLETGLLQLISVNASIYPPLQNLKRNFNDADLRVTWRSKQVVDFAYMFHYSTSLSTYYMQIEDDVITAKNLLASINKCIISQSSDWTVLEFSELGFIGKLFRTRDLPRFAKFLLLFYEEQPIDFLYAYFYRLLTQQNSIICKPTLFQHFGVRSSLSIKAPNLLLDKYFDGVISTDDLPKTRTNNRVPEVLINIAAEPKIFGPNPPAMVSTTIEIYNNHVPMLAYLKSDDFFWGKRAKENDTICVLFNDKILLDAVSIATGHPLQRNDYLRQGYVTLSAEGQALENTNGRGACHCDSSTVNLGYLNSGQFHVNNLSSAVKFMVKCLQIHVARSQDEWLIISQINVWDLNTTRTTGKL